jgi:hypothetical protein
LDFKIDDNFVCLVCPAPTIKIIPFIFYTLAWAVCEYDLSLEFTLAYFLKKGKGAKIRKPQKNFPGGRKVFGKEKLTCPLSPL